MKNSVEDQQKYQSQLVEIKDVSFVGGGSETWAVQGSNGDNRYLQSANGQQLLVRNSGKSSFCTELLPAGTGTVVGVLQWFSNDWQFVFRTNEDCFGFTTDVTPPTPGEAVSSLNETFPTAAIPMGWSVKTTSGNRDWQAGSFSGNNFVKCTGYTGTAGANGFESWFISPAVDMSKVTDKVLSFTSQCLHSVRSR